MMNDIERRWRYIGHSAAAAMVIATMAAGCTERPADSAISAADNMASRPPLLPIFLPPMTGADGAARRQIQGAYDTVTAGAADRTLSPRVLGLRYGEMGKLFMAAELHDAAEPCLLNAATLLPDEPRWPYYLAHLYRRKGDLAKAATYLEQTLSATPDDATAWWWLGTVRLQQGRLDDAEAGFSRASTLRPGALSSVYGLGRVALARSDFATAVGYFERVLAMDARATAAHYPLAQAYRALGQLEKAQAHASQRSVVAIVPIDPLMDELGGLLQSTTAYHDRGMRAARFNDWGEAVTQFRLAVESAPDDADGRLALSAALSQTGDLSGAIEQARRAVELAPQDADARDVLEKLQSMAAHTVPR
jgi:tetratricopeptide (TPR) repeat protein